MSFRDPETAPKGDTLSTEWIQPPSSAAEFLRLRDEALEVAMRQLKVARSYGGYMSTTVIQRYDAALAELEFMRYWEERAGSLQAPEPNTPNDSTQRSAK